MAVSSNPRTAGVGVQGVGRDYYADFTTSVGVTGVAEQILKQITIPAGLLTSCAYFRIKVLWAKSGVTDSSTTRIRLGTAGTTADASIAAVALAIANRTIGSDSFFFPSSSTQVRAVGASTTTGIEAGATNATAYPVNTTVSDMATNNLVMSFTQTMSGSTDTPNIPHVILTLF